MDAGAPALAGLGPTDPDDIPNNSGCQCPPVPTRQPAHFTKPLAGFVPARSYRKRVSCASTIDSDDVLA